MAAMLRLEARDRPAIDSCFRPLEELISFFGWAAQASEAYCGSVLLEVSSY